MLLMWGVAQVIQELLDRDITPVIMLHIHHIAAGVFASCPQDFAIAVIIITPMIGIFPNLII